MSPKFQKRSTLKLDGRIILRSEYSNLFPKLALGFHTRDYAIDDCLKSCALVEIGILFLSGRNDNSDARLAIHEE
jgi:hypothetical protein